MGAPHSVTWIGNVLRAIPGPTGAWADIIGHVAWPVLIAFLVIRFRRYLRLFLDTIAERLQTDHVKWGPFELTPNSQVIVLDPEKARESTDDYAPEDIERIERIFEFISDTANFHKLGIWVNDHVDEALEVVDFVTMPEYAAQRAEAYSVLVEGG